jgi:DNA-binding LytR/AlgR family response regulator
LSLDVTCRNYTAGSRGRMLVRLKDERHTELPVARDRVRALKERLGN